MANITQISSMESGALSALFNDIRNTVRSYLPHIPEYNVYQVGYGHELLARYYLMMTAQLERLMFPDDTEVIHSINQMNYRITEREIERQLERAKDIDVPQFICNLSPRTRYDETRIEREGLKHLEAAEVTLKEQKNQFLKIFTYNTTLYIYTNKPLSFEAVLKLKALQWNLFKDKFEKEVPEITEFMQALYSENISAINKYANEIVNMEMFEQLRYQELIDIFKPDYKGMQRELIRQKENLQANYRTTENRLSEMLMQLNDLTEEIFNLETKMDKIENNTELIKYLKKHPYIKDVQKTASRTVSLYYEAPIIYFDDYIIKKLLPHKNGDAKRLLNVFMDNKYELMTRCKISFNTNNFNVEFICIGNGQIIRHPHIDRFNCFGNHKTAIREAAATGNYFGAIEQISQAVLNLNFTDTAVVNEMLANLINSSYLKTWRSKETGAFLTTDEILEIYHE